jgi:hypothetical protein
VQAIIKNKAEHLSRATEFLASLPLFTLVLLPRAQAEMRIPAFTANFSHEPAGKADRLDRFMGVEGGLFFLSQGGFIAGSTRYGEAFTRPAVGQPPGNINLPALPN